VRAEFVEEPGLWVTPEEAARLFAIRGDVCRRVLAELVKEGWLRETRDGRYARLADAT
jgi:DNA-binding IclR family transcriptional regulator